jgi:DNA-binding beta-propeller fold protein YncE
MIYQVDLHFLGVTGVAFSPATARMYFVGHDPQTGLSEIVIVHDSNVVQTINVTAYGDPTGVVYDDADNDLYVTMDPRTTAQPTILILS